MDLLVDLMTQLEKLKIVRLQFCAQAAKLEELACQAEAKRIGAIQAAQEKFHLVLKEETDLHCQVLDQKPTEKDLEIACLRLENMALQKLNKSAVKSLDKAHAETEGEASMWPLKGLLTR
ncbi:hypothetical protein FRC10_008504 [Ceratobasidium sp. 414]|nr:hypothetical protein FRC10_008504 [Ceratobasidium sp. 414]